jgi:predicted HAD superfamily phosphohydrolase YqeG
MCLDPDCEAIVIGQKTHGCHTIFIESILGAEVFRTLFLRDFREMCISSFWKG